MKKTYMTLLAIVIALPVFLLTSNVMAAPDDWEAPNALVDDIAVDGPDSVTAEDDWEAPNAVTDDIIIGGTDTVTTDDIILGGVDSNAPADDIVLGGIDTNAPDQGIIVGGWDSLMGIFSPGGWGVKGEAQDDIFMPGGWGVFGPGGWGLTGMDIEPVSGEAPSGFAMWWQGVKENVGLALTFNAEEKAQKRLQYAEQKMQMAGALTGQASDPDVQKKIEKLVGQAEKHISKIEKTRDKWFNPDSGKAQQMVGNIVRHNLNKDEILDKIETKIPEEKLDKIQEIREQGVASNKRLMNALENENIPSRVREHLSTVKEYIESQADEIQQFRTQKRELLEKRKAGDENADRELKQLQIRRKENIKNRIQLRQSYRPNPAGDGVAQPDDAGSGLPTGKRQIEIQPDVEGAGYIKIGDLGKDTAGTETVDVVPIEGVSPDVIDPLQLQQRERLRINQPEAEDLNTIGDDAQLAQ